MNKIFLLVRSTPVSELRFCYHFENNFVCYKAVCHKNITPRSQQVSISPECWSSNLLSSTLKWLVRTILRRFDKYRAYLELTISKRFEKILWICFESKNDKNTFGPKSCILRFNFYVILILA